MRKLVDEILSLERELMDPEVRSNAKKVQKLLREDFYEHCSDGTAYRYSEGDTFSANDDVMHEVADDFAVRQLSETVTLATYISRTTRNGQVSYANRSSVWILDDTGWKMAFHQGTPTTIKEK